MVLLGIALLKPDLVVLFSCPKLKQAKHSSQTVVLLNMADQERDTIMSIWDDKALRVKLEYDPYSLTQYELRQLESVDRLNEKLRDLVCNALVKKAIANTLKYKL